MCRCVNKALRHSESERRFLCALRAFPTGSVVLCCLSRKLEGMMILMLTKLTACRFCAPALPLTGCVSLQERLPTVPLSGMYNKSGGKVRLTFKLEQDQLWIGTKGEHLSASGMSNW